MEEFTVLLTSITIKLRVIYINSVLHMYSSLIAFNTESSVHNN